MKVKARNLKDRRKKNARDPWYRVRRMDDAEAQRAKHDIFAVLDSHTNGLSYNGTSPEEAVLQRLARRSDYGNKHRQTLVFKSVMSGLFKLGAISYDPTRTLISRNPNSFVK